MTRPPRPPPAVCLSAAELRRWRAHRTQDAAAAALLTPPRTYRYWELHGVTSQPKADGLRAAMRATPAASAAPAAMPPPAAIPAPTPAAGQILPIPVATAAAAPATESTAANG